MLELKDIANRLKKIDSSHELSWIRDFVDQQNLNLEESHRLIGNIVTRREKGEPLAYIFGSWAFFDYEFFVGPGVLIPRPETEELVELVLTRILEEHAWENSTPYKVIDLGAGSGCLGMSFLMKLFERLSSLGKDSRKISKAVELVLVEESSEAFSYMEKNWKTFEKHFLEAKISLVHSSWCAEIGENFDLVLSNPPYLREEEYSSIDSSVRCFEPRSALVSSSPEAIGAYQEILSLYVPKLAAEARVFFELGLRQDQILSDWVEDNFPHLFRMQSHFDLSGKARFLELTKIAPLLSSD